MNGRMTEREGSRALLAAALADAGVPLTGEETLEELQALATKNGVSDG